MLLPAFAQQGEPFKFESKVNVVVVPALVTDSHGRAIGTLKQTDFQVFDRGKRQVISRFTIQMRSGRGSQTALPPNSPAAVNPAPQAKVAPDRFIAFLFDDLHLSAGELASVRNAASKILAGSFQSTDMGAVLSTSGQTNTGFTRDPGKLRDAMLKLRPVTIYQSQHDCPEVSHYQAFEILSLFDAPALQAAAEDALRCNIGIDYQTALAMAKTGAARALAMGEQSTQITLDTVREVIRQMGNLPGQHTMVLSSPGFIALTPEAIQLTDRVLDAAAQANVTVNTLDARGLYTYALDASKVVESRTEQQVRINSLTTSADILEQLASGTLGNYFHNSNDFAGAFERLTEAPEYVYVLEFHPQHAPPDGSYHRLSVKVNAKGVKVRARSGYFAGKPARHRK